MDWTEMTKDQGPNPKKAQAPMTDGLKVTSGSLGLGLLWDLDLGPWSFTFSSPTLLTSPNRHPVLPVAPTLPVIASGAEIYPSGDRLHPGSVR